MICHAEGNFSKLLIIEKEIQSMNLEKAELTFYSLYGKYYTILSL